jgi:hypothetical protein
VFGAGSDPFLEMFHGDDTSAHRGGEAPEDFRGHSQVSSREGKAIARLLADFVRPAAAEDLPGPSRAAEPPRPAAAEPDVTDITDITDSDDADMVVIEEDLEEPAAQPAVFAVRPGDYRNLFTRLRRGDRRG